MLRSQAELIHSVVAFSREIAGHSGIHRLFLSIVFLLLAIPSAQAVTSTNTTLAVTSVSKTLPSGGTTQIVTLTATVSAGSTPVTPGQVAFCDMSTYCTGAHLYGIAQLTSAGTAVFRYQPFPGALRYKAIFLGTHTYAGSSSAESDLTVNVSVVPTATAASVSQTQFSATVSAFSSAAPTGSVTFTDQNSTNLGDSNLVSNPPAFVMNALVIDNGLTTTQVATLAGDFNGDGVLDFMEQLSPEASPGLPAGSIDVRLGNGDGSFGSAIPCGVSGVPASAFATGDFNGDGILDVVSYSTYFGSPNLLQILLGNGDGTFTPLPAVTIPQFASDNVSLIVGDWNRDGNLDIALTTYNSTSISLLWGNGDGTFSSSISSLSVNTFLSGFITGDFNNDGNPDIAVGEWNSSGGQLSIFYGDGAGNFTKTSVLSALSNFGWPFSLLTSDINNDGYADLLFVTNGRSYVLLGNSTESPTQGVYIPTFAFGASGVPVALADFNGDGVIDVASTSGGKSPVVLQLGYGDGTFSTGPQATVPGLLLSTPLLGDWAGNGVPNLLVSSDVNGKEADYYDYQNYILPPATQSATATLLIPSISVLPPGSYEITASYAGDSAYEPSTASFAYTRSVISTTLRLTASVNPGTYGGAGTLSATLSPSSQGSLTTNGDSVNFLANNVLLGTGTLTSGVATLPMAGIPPGTWSVEAVFAGDNNFTSATSNTINLTMNKASLTVSASNATRSYGVVNPTLTGTTKGAVNGDTFTVTGTTTATSTSPVGSYPIIPTASGTNLGNYSVTAVNGALSVTAATPVISWSTPATISYGTALGTTQLNASSTVPGTFAYSPAAGTLLSAGSHTLSTAFTPTDSTDYTMATNTVSIAITAATPVISWSTPATISYGTALGTTQLNASSTVPGTFAYSPAAGTVLNVGSHTLSTTLTPTDSTDYTTVANTVSITVNKATPAMTLTASSNPSFVSDSVTFIASVTSSVGSPSGTVTCYDGTTSLGSATLSSGSAAFITTLLAAGSHSVTAVYSGDSSFASVTSNSVAEVIEDFTISVSGSGSTTATVAPGGTATYIFTVAPPSSDQSAAPITFSVSGLPSGATGAFSPATLARGSGSTNVTLTVSVPSTAVSREPAFPFHGSKLPFTLAALLLPFAARLRGTGKQLRRFAGGLQLLAIAGLLSLLFACGGSSSSSGGNKSVTPQNYSLTITATSGSLSHTTTVMLVVD